MKVSEIQECRTDNEFGLASLPTWEELEDALRHHDVSQVKPGIYPDMKESEYHRGQGRESLSKSLLVELSRSPAHCRAAMDAPREPTAAMTFGTACHTAVLEPERFGASYTMFEGDRRTKAGKDAYQAILDSGQTPISAGDMEIIRGMSDAVREHSLCRDLLSEGSAEVSLFWNAPVWEIMCKCRCDWLNQNQRVIVDLKTCVDASPGAFRRDAARYKYHWQASWYLEGAKTILGPGPWRFIFVAVEKSPPYGVGVYELPQEALDAAREQVGPLVSIFWNCREEQAWPGYEPAIKTLNLPGWALNTEEDFYE